MLTIRELGRLHAAWADDYYRKPSGRRSGEARNLAFAWRHAEARDPRLPAGSVSPSWLRSVRDLMIGDGLARTTINARVNRIRRVFRWAVSREMVDAAVLTGLQAVEALQPHRSPAAEPAGVRAAAEGNIEAAAAASADPIATMLRLQLLTGMRSGELVTMRRADVSTDDAGHRMYKPREHKTEHLGFERIVPLGPRAAQLLDEQLKETVDPFLFPGLEGERFVFPTRRGTRYTTATYRLAVRRSCRRAGVELFTPHQVRHAAATRLRRLLGIEAARVVLGHRRLSTTEIYAEADTQSAIDAMQLVG